MVAALVLVGAGGFLVLREKKAPSSEKTVQQEISPQKTNPVEPIPSEERSIQSPRLTIQHKKELNLTPPAVIQPPLPRGVPSSTITPSNSPDPQNKVIWSSRDFTWYPSSNPSVCSEPFILLTPVDMGLVAAALWPGQVRGEYKAHGGFRFNNDGSNDITVRAPVGSHLIQASQYLESGEKQYLLIFSVPCGFVYRFDHPRVLSPKIAEAVKNLPPATENDSRTTYINPPVWVDAGEIVATSVGITKNIFVDFGLYDVRKPNNVTPNPTWAELYAADKEFGHYGVCFFDYLPGNDGATMRSLPTGKEGKVSDYCK